MRIALATALAIAAASVAGCIWLVEAYHVDHFFGAERRTTFLFGELDSTGMYLLLSQIAAIALLAAVVIGLSLASRIAEKTLRRMTYAGLVAVLIIGIPLAGLHLLGAWLKSTAVYTEIEGATVDRDLVIREWSFLLAGGGDVFERDGSTLTLIGKTGADDGQAPFARGEYTAVEVAGVVTLEWVFDGPVKAHLVIGEPDLGPPSTYDGLYHFDGGSAP